MSSQSKLAIFGLASLSLVGCSPAGTVTGAETANPAIIGEVGVSYFSNQSVTTFTPANNPNMRCVLTYGNNSGGVACYPAPEAKSAAPSPQ